MTTTCGCGQPTGDQAYVCQTCTGRVQRDLRDLAGIPHPDGAATLELAAQLDQVLARLTAYGDRAGGRAAEHPLPYDARASEAGWVLRNTLTSIVRLIVEERGVDEPEWGSGKLDVLAGWLLRHVEWLRHHPAGYEIADEIWSVVRDIRRIVDRPADRWYAGRCGCETDLYARAGSQFVTCQGCGTSYNVRERREWLRTAVEDVLATTTEISRALTTLAVPITSSSIRGYVHRGRLFPHGADIHGRPLYRVGDVLDLVVVERARAS